MQVSTGKLYGHVRLRSGMARHQRGISMMMVLISLVVMSLAAVALVRMVDTGTLVVGNVAFKQATTSAADNAAENGIAYLVANSGTNHLHTDKPDEGYYATSRDELDVSGNEGTRATRVLIDWSGNACAYAAENTFAECITPSNATSVNGYAAQYIITRLCRGEGEPSATSNECSRPVAQSSSPSEDRGGMDYTNYERFENAPPSPYFRIIVRSVGPRNTISITETYVHL